MAVGEKAESILRKLNPFWTNLEKLIFFETARTFFSVEFRKSYGRDRIPLVETGVLDTFGPPVFLTDVGMFRVAENDGRRKS